MKKKFLNVIAISALVSLGALTAVSCNPETPTEDPVEVTYKVTYDTGNYTVSGIKADGYKEGDTVTFTVTAASGYEITSVSAGGTALTPASNGEYSFTMGSSDVKLTITATAKAASMKLDKTEITFDELGLSETVTATLSNIEGTVSWEITDDVNFAIEVSEDTLSCKVTNVGGGTAVLTASIGDISSDVLINGSTFGDTRASYTIYKDDGTVYLDDVKGFFNAVGKLNDDETVTTGYVTAKGGTDKLYVRDNAWLTALAKDGPTDETEGLANFVNGKVSSWVAGYPTQQVDKLSEANIVITQKESGTYNYFNQRATNWFENSELGDKMPGYVPNTTDPSLNLWSGWRASEYLGAITTAQYVSWHDGKTMNWSSVEQTYDLSGSTLTPSYNEEQGVFAQIYVGSTTRIQKLTGMYFYAGTIEENKDLEDGTTREIYTFQEALSLSGGLTSSMLGERTIDEEHPIGEAVWDAENRARTFPKFKVNLRKDIVMTGEDSENPDANYYCVDTVTGYSDGEEVASVEYKSDFGSQIVRGVTTDSGGSLMGERITYGVSFTPDHEKNYLPDITCGAQWTNVLLEEAIAHYVDGETPDMNMQFMMGRTTNSAAQLAIVGADSCTGALNSDQQSVFNFNY